jgi:long-chain acyl-CoA synthetase
MTVGMNLGILQGSCLILMERFQLEEAVQLIETHKPTRFLGMPTIYVALNSHPRIQACGMDNIKICHSGGAPIPVELIHEIERKTGVTIMESYGLTECSPGVLGQPSKQNRRIGSVGIPLPMTDCKIVDLETGTREMPPGERGELIIKGPQVMKSYWQRPEEMALAFRDGWLYTGDIAQMDEDGYFYIVDRKKDMIIASGYNVYPREIEEVLYQHPAVREAVVVGVKDPYRGETVKAFISLKAGAAASEEEIIQHCKSNLSAYKVPKLIDFRPELPKSDVGKLLRKVLAEEAAGGKS